MARPRHSGQRLPTVRLSNAVCEGLKCEYPPSRRPAYRHIGLLVPGLMSVVQTNMKVPVSVNGG